MFVFRKIWRFLLSCNIRFEIRPFDLLPAISLPFPREHHHDYVTCSH